jgi:hypothetical protein
MKGITACKYPIPFADGKRQTVIGAREGLLSDGPAARSDAGCGLGATLPDIFNVVSVMNAPLGTGPRNHFLLNRSADEIGPVYSRIGFRAAP